MIDQRIVVLNPKGERSGGPEAVYELVHELNNNNVNAVLAAIPLVEDREEVASYAHYSCPSIKFDDIAEDDIVISPEIAAFLDPLFDLDVAQKCIWWLSVQNSPTFVFSSVHSYPLTVKASVNVDREKKKQNIKMLLHKLKNTGAKDAKKYLEILKNDDDILHIFQTEYSKHWVKEKLGKSGVELIDYKNMKPLKDMSVKNPTQICYNAVKDIGLIKELEPFVPELTFVPIQNMTYEEVEKTLEESTYYIDFGHQPGNDGLPREAALKNCLIILAKRGAVKDNKVDFPINEACRLDYTTDLLPNAANLLKKLNSDQKYFDKNFEDQEFYRNKVRNEKDVFKKQVKELIKHFEK